MYRNRYKESLYNVIPAMLQTVLVPGMGIHRPVITRLFYETPGVTNTRGSYIVYMVL